MERIRKIGQIFPFWLQFFHQFFQFSRNQSPSFLLEYYDSYFRKNVVLLFVQILNRLFGQLLTYFSNYFSPLQKTSIFQNFCTIHMTIRRFLTMKFTLFLIETFIKSNFFKCKSSRWECFGLTRQQTQYSYTNHATFFNRKVFASCSRNLSLYFEFLSISDSSSLKLRCSLPAGLHVTQKRSVINKIKVFWITHHL